MKKETPYTHSRVKNYNKALILKLICTGRENTRSGFARISGLSKMTLSNIVAELIAEEYICEIDRSAPGVSQGRKPIQLDISPAAPHVVGIFIGRVDCQLVVSTIDAKIIRHANVLIQPGITKESLLAQLYERYVALVSGIQNPILGIGIASIGPIDKTNGLILNPPDFYGMKNIPVRSFFHEKTHLPIHFDNNMNAAALAEKLFGHGKELSNMAYIGVMHGVGAGIITKGQLLEGPSGINGELGHTSINFDGELCQCGNRGCLELYASIPRVVEMALREMKEAGVPVLEGDFDWAKLTQYARDGEYYSLRALNRLCEYLAVGIVNIVNLLDCEEIFLGHDIALAEGLVEERLEQLVNENIFASNIKRIRVRMSAFGVKAPLAGSICLVLNALFGK